MPPASLPSASLPPAGPQWSDHNRSDHNGPTREKNQSPRATTHTNDNCTRKNERASGDPFKNILKQSIPCQQPHCYRPTCHRPPCHRPPCHRPDHNGPTTIGRTTMVRPDKNNKAQGPLHTQMTIVPAKTNALREIPSKTSLSSRSPVSSLIATGLLATGFLAYGRTTMVRPQ